MPPSGVPPTALNFCTFGTLLGIYAFIWPLSSARQFGFELRAHANQDFIYIFGGRNIAT